MLLEVRNLSVSYKGIQALRDVSLHVNRGEMVALVGSNGAGKSTLLNALSRTVVPQRGQVVFDGKDLGRMAAFQVSRQGLLHVPEGRQVLADMSVWENLQLGMLALGQRPARYSLEQVYGIFPILEERADQIAGTLSGGQQQMLAIGRALMGAPEILLLDEPSLGLSPLMGDQVFDALTRLNREGLTILLVEQNAYRALECTQRAYVLDRGRIVMEGASDVLMRDQRVIESYLGA
ncbi:ABC transporter ATP-binding protein (plasmid) [Paracoccus versutus]|uniref:Branched-chain amino acid transport system ATP-binding protein n=2 Tax=Paracoccus TaxID=265 RepID=A0AAQ0KKA0_PARVE|nr:MULTISPECIES: ABC transporter ATP-binding protein [Paracoccus]WGR61762.1 ABC transporter ATP-binding protein [Paracoccus ferrooxidans]KGJ09205.1 amino acid ABC transporter ATPase [Paracoccus versutus]MBT0782633.1 ABC transporter ATP-binding protein [Paracoccus sp. pheM1]MCJ1901022.1 ABC transporter ATP-binding protein [Paracoccus versutus]MDF3853856.1 ABC transporter ATP-binding protein [Paracoccus pantotrophus]